MLWHIFVILIVISFSPVSLLEAGKDSNLIKD